jgi:hypothetical protein
LTTCRTDAYHSAVQPLSDYRCWQPLVVVSAASGRVQQIDTGPLVACNVFMRASATQRRTVPVATRDSQSRQPAVTRPSRLLARRTESRHSGCERPTKSAGGCLPRHTLSKDYLFRTVISVRRSGGTAQSRQANHSLKTQSNNVHQRPAAIGYVLHPRTANYSPWMWPFSHRPLANCCCGLIYILFVANPLYAL